jgi:hypothetical protein
LSVKLQDQDHIELLMLMAMRYPILGISSTCASFILDSVVWCCQLISVIKQWFLSTLDYIKGSYQPDSVKIDYFLKGFSNQGNLYRFIPTWITQSG